MGAAAYYAAKNGINNPIPMMFSQEMFQKIKLYSVKK
jgi:hypothetical protein